MTDVKVGLGIDDDGTISRYLNQVKELDKTIANLLKNNKRLESQQIADFKQSARELKTIQQALQSYARDKFNIANVNTKTPAGKKAVAEYDSFIKSVGQLNGDFERRFELAQKRLTQQEKQFQNEIKRNQQENVRNQRNLRLQKINSPSDLSGMSAAEAKQLAGQARYMSRYNNGLGIDSKLSDKRLDLLTGYLRDLAKPGIAQRQSTIDGLVGSKQKLQKFLKEATPEMLQEFSKSARKMSRSAFDAGDSTRGQSLAGMAAQFKQSMAKMAPTFIELQRLTKDILSPRGKTLKNVSRENLQQTQQQMAIIRREMNKSTSAGKPEEAARYNQALTKLGAQFEAVKQAPRLSRVQELSPLLAAGGDFDKRFNDLANGRSIAALDGLRKAANQEYTTRLGQKDDATAEGWRQVVAKLDEQIKQQKLAQKPQTDTIDKTIQQKQAEIDNRRVQDYARTAYDGRGLAKSTDVLERMSQTDLEGLKRQGQLRLKAQQFRTDSATGPAKAEEERILAVLKEQLRTLEQQLNIRKRIDQQRANKASPELQANRQQEEAEKAAQRNSPDANRARVAQGLQQRALVREMDGGAEMFRNQMMLLRNYAVMGAGVGGAYSTASFIVGLDKSFKQLQSILALTNNDMAKLKGELIEVSELTKFDALEVVDTSIILGQAGLNKEQIVRSIEGITLFATAVGTDLKSAVDLATSALGVYNIEASRMPEIVDKLTISINKSKLNMDKLSLGIQYAGNIAEQSNVSFEETVSALAAMANSGIKSGSTLGTGLRQILITLQKPSDAFKKKMLELGIGMDQLDLKTHSLTDVMATLSQSGFTVVDAMQTMEVRAAAAFGAYANNIDTAREINKQMQEGGAATNANTVQMEALANQWARFSSVAKSIFYDALEPMVEVLVRALTTTTDWLSELKASGDMIQYIVSGLVTLGALKSTFGILNLGGRLITGGIKAVKGGSLIGGAAAGAAGAGSKSALMASVVTVIRTILGGPWIWGLAAAGAGAFGLYSYMKNDGRLNDPLDRARFNKGAIDARLERNEMGVTDITRSISQAYYRQDTFDDSAQGVERLASFVGDLNSKLRSVGFYMDPTTASFDGLIEKLQETRNRLLEFRDIDLAKQASAGVDIANAESQAFAGRKTKNPFAGSENTPEQLFKRLNFSGKNTAGREETGLKLRQIQGFGIAAPELKNIFTGTGIASQGTYQRSPFENLTSEIKALNVADTPSSVYATYQRQLEEMYSQITVAKGKDLVEIANKVGLPEKDLKAVIAQVEQEIIDTKQTLDTIRTSLLDKEGFDKNTGLNLIRDNLVKQFEPQSAGLIQDIGRKSLGIINSDQTRNDPLQTYQNYEVLKGEAQTAISQFVELVKQQVREQIAANPELDVKRDAPQLINSLPLFAELNNLQGELKQNFGDLKAPAAKAFRRQSRGELQSIDSQLEQKELELSDANTTQKILEIGRQIDELRRRQFEINKAQAVMDSGDDEATLDKNIEDLQEQALAETETNLHQMVMRLAEHFAQKEMSQGIITADTLPNAKGQAMALALADPTWSGNHWAKNGEDYKFGLNGLDSRILKAQARAVDDVIKRQRSEEEELLKQRQAGAENIRTDAEDLKRVADDSLEGARDTGMPEAQQFMSLTLASEAMRIAGDKMAEYIDAQKAAVEADLEAKRQRLNGYENTLSDPNLNVFTRRVLEREVNTLKPAIAGGEIELEKLDRELAKNTAETTKQTNEIKGNTEQLRVAGRRFLTEDRRRMTATIRGETYQTDAQIARGQGEVSNPGTTGGDLGDQLRNGVGDVLTESYKAYEGIDLLTEGMLGLKDIVSSMGDTMGGFFSEFARGSMTAGEAFRGFAKSVADALTDLATQYLANAIMQQIIGFAVGAMMPAGSGGAPMTNSAGGFQPSWNGGPVGAPRRYNQGGLITSGMRSRDSTLIHAAQGEFVLRQAAVDAIGLEGAKAINSLDKNTVKSLESVKSKEPEAKDEGDKTVNIWVVSEEEAKQSMNENGILVVVDKALMRNSNTKKLVKRIVMGDM